MGRMEERREKKKGKLGLKKLRLHDVYIYRLIKKLGGEKSTSHCMNRMDFKQRQSLKSTKKNWRLLSEDSKQPCLAKKY